MPRFHNLLSILAALVLVSVPGPAAAETVDEKPRIAVAIANAPQPFLRALSIKLGATRRFQVIENGTTVRSKLGVLLSPALTLQNAMKARRAGGVELLLDGKAAGTNGQLRVTTRLYDFRTAEFSRDLSLIGDTTTVDALAGQLAAYVRAFAPLKCLVRDMNEDQLVLDLGDADGVTVGTTFRAYRHNLNMKPLELGSVKVVAVTPFAATAEVEDAPKGTTFQRGDMLMEKTADLLIQ